MYIEHLEEATLPIDDIFLDPNNPRFWSEKSGRDIPDKKIPDQGHQAAALEEITKFGVEELLTSILRNGFLPLDRIVVRQIDTHSNKYVVVEGNRRLAALKTLRKRIEDGLIDEEDISEEHLQQLKTATDAIEVLIYNGTEGEEIAWMLQGIRHISGIRSWSPAQQGKLVADQIDRQGMKFREAGQSLGLSARSVGQRYRAYKALEQMRSDEEFRAKAENKYYSLFEEALGSQSVKTWLGWSDHDFSFHNENNLKQFYSWITPDENHEESKRRIHDPRHIKKLGALIAGDHKSLLDQIDSHALEIEVAYDRAKGTGPRRDWKHSIQSATLLLKEIPQSVISDAPDEVKLALEELLKVIEGMRVMADAISREAPKV